jgi:hypothetical protein
MDELNREEAVMGYAMLVIALILIVWLCLIPSRHSDGRIPEDVAREMYDASLEEPLIGGDQ